jgi:DNA-binding IclR family transcriptional regulator
VSRNGKPHASLYDFRDLDLMLAIAEGAEGISSTDLAEAIGLGEEGARAAGIRLSWMRRYGMVKFDDDKRLWTLTRGAERVTEAKLRAAAAKTIDAVPDESLVDVMAHVTTRWRLGDPMNAQLLRREFLFGTQRR